MDNSSLTKPCYHVFLTLLSKKRGRSKVALWEMRFFIQEKSQKVPPPHIAGVALLPMNKITRTDNKTLPSVVWYAKSPFVILTFPLLGFPHSAQSEKTCSSRIIIIIIGKKVTRCSNSFSILSFFCPGFFHKKSGLNETLVSVSKRPRNVSIR